MVLKILDLEMVQESRALTRRNVTARQTIVNNTYGFPSAMWKFMFMVSILWVALSGWFIIAIGMALDRKFVLDTADEPELDALLKANATSFPPSECDAQIDRQEIENMQMLQALVEEAPEEPIEPGPGGLDKIVPNATETEKWILTDSISTAIAWVEDPLFDLIDTFKNFFLMWFLAKIFTLDEYDLGDPKDVLLEVDRTHISEASLEFLIGELNFEVKKRQKLIARCQARRNKVKIKDSEASEIETQIEKKGFSKSPIPPIPRNLPQKSKKKGKKKLRRR